MKSLQTIDGVLEELKPGMTVNALAKNMCDPFWQANQFQQRDEMAAKIGEMKDISDRATLEIQHKLIDEFVDSLESPDEEYRREVLELMSEFIPLETRRDIAAIVLQGALVEEEAHSEGKDPGENQQLGLRRGI
jgi:hypothetical protein